MVGVKFDTSWKRSLRRLRDAITFNRIQMMMLAIAIVLLALSLAGCTSTSSSILSIYLLSLSYQQGPIGNDNLRSNPNLPYLLRATAGNTTLEVRSAYFMLCVSSDPPQGVWECNTNSAALARIYASDDPLNLIEYSDKFRSQVVFYGLIIAAIVLAVAAIISLSMFPGWHTDTSDTGSEHEVKPFPTQVLLQAVGAFLFPAVLFAFVSILWQHIATAAVATSIGTMLDGAVVTHVGPAIMILGWLGVAWMILALLGFIVMILSINLLDRLTEED